MDQKEFNEKIKTTIDGWKTRLEELELQLSLGTMEAADELEKQKGKLKNRVDNLKDDVEKLTGIGDEKIKTLRTRLEELQVQLALGKAEGKDAFEEQKQNIEKLLDTTMVQFREFVKDFDKTYQQTAENFESISDGFKTKLDILHLQFVLGKAEAEKLLAEKKKELQPKISELNRNLEKFRDQSEERWEDFRNEVKEGFSHIKKAIKGILS